MIAGPRFFITRIPHKIARVMYVNVYKTASGQAHYGLMRTSPYLRGNPCYRIKVTPHEQS